MPPRKATGTNTEQSTKTIAISARVTWRIARSAATAGDTCSSSMMRSTFSITTIASSTTMPIASTRPNKVSRLTEKPSSRMPKKAPITETGTASTGISVARQLWRKRNTTSVTSPSASNSVFATSLIDAVMKGVVSKATCQCTPCGKLLASSVIRATTACFVWSAFAPGRRNTGVSSVGVPSRRPAKS